jgi:capsular polysaccharide biosynthesis protein
VAERRKGVRQGVIVLAGAAVGLLAGLALTLVSDDAYRAKTVLEVSAAPDPGAPAREAKRLPAVVLAETYARMLDDDAFLAGITAQVAAGRLSSEVLAQRVEATHPDGSALVELTAEGGSRQEAQAVASDVVSAFVALVQQLARQRTQQLEDELRRRMNDLGDGPVATARRAALAARLAEVATRGVEQAASVRVAAQPYAPPDRVRPETLQNLAGGLLLGLVAGLGATLLRRRERAEAPVAIEPWPVAFEPAYVPEPFAAEPEYVPEPFEVEPEYVPEPFEAEPEPVPEPEPVDATPPRVALWGPAPESTVAGSVPLRLEAWDDESGIDSLELLASEGGAEWRQLATFEADLVELDWDSTALPDGVYWLSAVARDRAGHAAATAPLPVLVANGAAESPPDARLSSPA